MTKLLFIKASPRKGASSSIAVAQSYLDALRGREPDLDVDEIDLWGEDLPAFDGDRANAELAILGGQHQSEGQQTTWARVTEIAQRFIGADHYLFAMPMWNSGIPYRLKQYIDIIHQPGMTFALDPKTGYSGLLKDKKATLVYTAGAFDPSSPSPAFGIDHQSTYMRAWLSQAGVLDLQEIRHQPTVRTQDRDGDLARAKQAAAAAALAPASLNRMAAAE